MKVIHALKRLLHLNPKPVIAPELAQFQRVVLLAVIPQNYGWNPKQDNPAQTSDYDGFRGISFSDK